MTMDAKAQFEKWLSDTGTDTALDTWTSATEGERMRRVMLITWMASREELVIELPDPWGHVSTQSYELHVIDAIERAGVKVK